MTALTFLKILKDCLQLLEIFGNNLDICLGSFQQSQCKEEARQDILDILLSVTHSCVF